MVVCRLFCQRMLVFLLIWGAFVYCFAQGKFGVNLSHEFAFVNIMDETHRFTECESYDSLGWPQSDCRAIFDWRLVAEWAGSADDPEQYRINRSGTYKCSFEGKAELDVTGADIINETYDENTNVTTFDLVVGEEKQGNVYFHIEFSNTERTPGNTNSGFTNLRMIRPGYPLDTEQIFTDEFVALCQEASFSCFRYYPVQNIWDGVPEYPEMTKWQNRKLPSHASQKGMLDVTGTSEAWCWEYIIELANILDKDIWVNFHVSCDDEYMTRAAQMLKRDLNPGINIYFEYGNEIWSPTWTANGIWIGDQAQELGMDFDECHAMNVARMSDVLKNVFGADAMNNRIRVVMGAQAGYLGRSVKHLNYLEENHGAPKDYIYALSHSLYFKGTGETVEEALNACHSSMMSKFDQGNENSYINFMQLATEFELPGRCVSYEGEIHNELGLTENLAVDIGKHRQKRTATEQYLLYSRFFEIGGSLACHFSIWSDYQRYGCFGLTDDPFNPDRNYKFKMARTLCGDSDGLPVLPAPDAPDGLEAKVTQSAAVELSWRDNATDEDGQEIWIREHSRSDWIFVKTVGPDRTSAVIDTLMEIGKTYDFRVRCYNFGSWSEFSSEASAENTTGSMSAKKENGLECFSLVNRADGALYFTGLLNVKNIRILDLNGRTVWKTSVPDGQNKFVLDDHVLNQGVYILVWRERNRVGRFSHVLFR
ncbi:MAG: hypothetical protein ACLFQB_12540 [Chitinispirillaceae bacterium]